MAEFSITHHFSNSGTRNEVRMRVVQYFSNELPGKGKGINTSRFTYYVEDLSDGNRVYLRRPANLHYGFDFLVCVEELNFAVPGKKRRNYPKHTDILQDLYEKKLNNPVQYNSLYRGIEQVYYCHDIHNDEYIIMKESIGYPAELIIKVLKWLFIEQDIRYWSYSGRDMLWSGIPKP